MVTAGIHFALKYYSDGPEQAYFIRHRPVFMSRCDMDAVCLDQEYVPTF